MPLSSATGPAAGRACAVSLRPGVRLGAPRRPLAIGSRGSSSLCGASLSPLPSRGVLRLVQPRWLLGPARATASPPAQLDSSCVAALTGAAPGSVVQLYRAPGLAPSKLSALLESAKQQGCENVSGVESELCFNVALSAPLTEEQARVLLWLLSETFEPHLLTSGSRFAAGKAVVEVGPRMSFSTAWSTNAVSICASCGLSQVTRLESSRRFALQAASSSGVSAASRAAFASAVHDRMTETVYPSPLRSFVSDAVPAPVVRVPVLAKGRRALEELNESAGLAFDDHDLDYYTDMFANRMKRDPTNVELFDMAQSNSEHSRHWFFRGELVIDGQRVPESNLMDVVRATLRATPDHSVIGFADNSSAIRGGEVEVTLPAAPGQPSPLAVTRRDWDVLLTAETHNFPCAVAPYPGAETGAGGRIRDTHATGRGSVMGAATAGYCVGNLRLPGYEQPWERDSGAGGDGPASFEYPASLASPAQILTEASDGASDYGNKFGEPLIAGFTRSFGLRDGQGARREWLKPIMFSAGLGRIDHGHLRKDEPELGMLVVKIGGPAYRIGMGGGAASSVPSGSLSAELDFNAVQRGDAETAQKLWRVVRACVELGADNPIASIHDQGAGGNCNVVKEIVHPLGARVDVKNVTLGDETMSVLEIWGAEYQENDCLLVRPDKRHLLEDLARRERCGMDVIGTVDGSGRLVLVDTRAGGDAEPVVDLVLEDVLGDVPPKTFHLQRTQGARGTPLDGLLPCFLKDAGALRASLSRVLRLPAVCSKRFLTNKVDRCVGGLVAQQQCVGPLHTPLADVAALASSHWNLHGAATAIGEQPLKGLLDPRAMARLSLAESLLNLCFAPWTSRRHIKASGNWMHAAKLGGEGADLYDAAVALRDAMVALSVAVDGGKDSLSMAAAAGGETVVAPGALVVSTYVTCPDVTAVVTPDLKPHPDSVLVHVDLSDGRRRLGGSALAQVYGALGTVPPDVDDVAGLGRALDATQKLVREGALLAGHDVSDGGLAVALLEMAFAGNRGFEAALDTRGLDSGEDRSRSHAAFFAEEPGLVFQVAAARAQDVLDLYAAAGVRAVVLGAVEVAEARPSSARASSARHAVRISLDGKLAVNEPLAALRAEWEETSWRMEERQASLATVAQERLALEEAAEPRWSVPYAPGWTDSALLAAAPSNPAAQVAVLREEGTNGDREMSSALLAAGLQPWDVTMSDLLSGRVTLDRFRGVVFPGGFSYADVLDSGKGWAAAIRFNDHLKRQFADWYARDDTWSLGVCNGCQLMALLGWVPGADVAGKNEPGASDASPLFLPDASQPRFVHNASGRFECRWATVGVEPDSPAVLLRGMGGARLGVWVAHGEGRAVFPDEGVKRAVLGRGLAPMRYVDASGSPTEAYPANPNGSPDGVAALCSPNGRHLAMMPHPERCYLMWQNPWWPADVGLSKRDPGPWLKLFQNAREWVLQQQ